MTAACAPALQLFDGFTCSRGLRIVSLASSLCLFGWLAAQATMDWEAQDEGVIAKILAPDGAKDIPVGTVVAVVVEDAEHVRALPPQILQRSPHLISRMALMQAALHH